MPNWVRNIVTVSKETMNQIKEKYFENGELTFNKVIPMPKTLQLDDGLVTDMAIFYAVYKKSSVKQKEIIDILKQKQSEYSNIIERYMKKEMIDMVNKEAKEYEPSKLERTLGITTFEELGDTYINNIRNYSFATWYKWCIKNWGTKWDVSEFWCDETTMIFNTAWSVPENIFEKISREFPEDDITVRYADECYSNENNGVLHYKNGLLDYSLENEDFADKVWREKTKDIDIPDITESDF